MPSHKLAMQREFDNDIEKIDKEFVVIREE